MTCQLPFRFSIFFVAVLLLGSEVAAETAVLQADLNVALLHGDSARIAGPLVAFFQEHTDSETGGASPDFTLQAARLRIETDTADPAVNGIVIDAKPQQTTTQKSYDAAVVHGRSNGALYRWNAFSSDQADPAQVTVSTRCADARPADVGTIRRAPWAGYDTRPTTTRDASRALLWNCLEGASVQVKGDFWISLWVWDANLTAGGSTQELRSGRHETGIFAGPPQAAAVVGRDTEVYLYATNATLTVPALTGKGYTLLTGVDTQVSASRLELQEATGHVSAAGQTQSLQGNAVTISGQSTAVLTATGVGQPFNVQLVGDAQGLVVDGRTVTVPMPANRGPWPWLAGAVGLVAIPALAAPVLWRRAKAARKHRLDALVAQCQDLTNRACFDEARALAAKALSLQPNHARGHFLMARSLGGLLDIAGALHHHRQAAVLLRFGGDPDLRGENALQAACTLASSSLARDRAEEIVGWMQEARSANEALVQEFYRSRPLRPFLRALNLPDPDDASVA